MLLTAHGRWHRPCRVVPPAGPTLVWGYDAAVGCVLRMQRVVFADSDGDGVADIGSEQVRQVMPSWRPAQDQRDRRWFPRAVRRVVTGQNARALLSLEQRFDNEGAGMSTTTQMTALGPGRGAPRAIVAPHVHQQRRGYARAVLRALTRNQQGRPTAQVQRMLWNCLTPLGVRLSPATLHKLAVDITAGRPLELS
jgi:hypothetical protein